MPPKITDLRNVDYQPLFRTFSSSAQNVSKHPYHLVRSDPNGKGWENRPTESTSTRNHLNQGCHRGSNFRAP